MARLWRSILLSAGLALTTSFATIRAFSTDSDFWYVFATIMFLLFTDSIVDIKAAKQNDAVSVSPLVARKLTIGSPRLHVEQIMNKHALSLTRMHIHTYDKIKVGSVEAQAAVVLAEKCTKEELTYLLALTMSEESYMQRGWRQAIEKAESAAEDKEKAESARKQVQTSYAKQLKELGIRASAIDKLNAEVEHLSRKTTMNVVTPAPVNFDHQNALLEKQIYKLREENSALREKLVALRRPPEETEETEAASYPPLPEKNVLYLDGDAKRRNTVAERHPGWYCMAPAISVKLNQSNYTLIVVQKFMVKHRHTQLLASQLPNAQFYVTDRANFEDDLRCWLATGSARSDIS